MAGEFGRLDLKKWCPDHGLSGRRKEWLCRLFDELRQSRKALTTKRTYLGWVRRFLIWHGERDFAPDAGEIGKFINEVGMEGQISAQTQKQALNALNFFARRVLGLSEVDYGNKFQARQSKRNVVVASPEEIRELLECIPAACNLIVQLLYGLGLRLMECVRLRIKDIDFANGWILVYDGKGKSREELGVEIGPQPHI